MAKYDEYNRGRPNAQGEPMCAHLWVGDSQGGYCSLRKNHAGPHKGYSSNDTRKPDHLFAEWPNASANAYQDDVFG